MGQTEPHTIVLEDGYPEYEKALEEAFSKMDLDNDGYIDKAEFGKTGEDIIRDLGEQGSYEEKLNSLFAKYDKNKDKKISKDEFRVILKDMLVNIFKDYIHD